MESNKKFTKKSFYKFVVDSLKTMDIEDVETINDGLYLFKKIVEDYMKDKYGSTKRESDLLEYNYIVSCTLMRKYKEIEKELKSE